MFSFHIKLISIIQFHITKPRRIKRINMIKQSQICNFASLIKTLRKQRSNPSMNNTNANSKSQKSTRTLNPYKYQEQQRGYNRSGKKYHRHNKTSEGVVGMQYGNHSVGCGIDSQFSDQKFQVNSEAFKKKKAFQVYCQEKRKKLARFQTISLHKFSELTCDGTSFIQYSRKFHKKIGQTRQKTKNMKVQTDQDVQIDNYKYNKLQNFIKNQKRDSQLSIRAQTQNLLIQKSKSRLSCKTSQKFHQISQKTNKSPITMKNISVQSTIFNSPGTSYRPPSTNSPKNSVPNRQSVNKQNKMINKIRNDRRQCWIIEPWQSIQTQGVSELIMSQRYV